MPTTAHVPLILIRGFGGLGTDDERQVAYQGFNDGTVYPHKRGENYIYEGMILKYLKSRWRYHDATNVVGYYREPVIDRRDLPEALRALDQSYFTGHRVVIDAGTALSLLDSPDDPRRSLWVFRYYDLDRRSFSVYGEALVRLIDFVRDLTAVKRPGEPKPPVNVIAHSMGGLIVREAVQVTLPGLGRRAAECINKIVTLGTPHRGISFQGVRDWKIVDADEELERFNPAAQDDPENPWGYRNFARHFPPERVLCVVGTNYKSYSARAATTLNRLFSAPQEYGWNYNRSDGLVKQTSAQLPGSPRTFVHKCHGGYDSVVTARESFEVATRFLHGDLRARINLISARVKRGLDRFGRSEIFFGMSIKPRRVDFELFHQSPEAENCYGPFRSADLDDDIGGEGGFGWAGPDRLIWEGWLDTARISPAAVAPPASARRDMVFRLDFYVGERDLLGVGFSDNVVFRKQYYLRAAVPADRSLADSLDEAELFLYTGEDFEDGAPATPLVRADGRWSFGISGTGFEATLGLELDHVADAAGDVVPV
jgi:pimeloyl-ACP methyl ester carboxylesterase